MVRCDWASTLSIQIPSSAGTATLVALAELTNNNETALAVDRANKLLATVQFDTSDVRLYNFADPDNPVLMDTKNLILGASVANANGTGDVKFGNGMLYVLNTNNGIQAFEVVPEPVWACLSALGMAAGLMCRRRGPRRSRRAAPSVPKSFVWRGDLGASHAHHLISSKRMSFRHYIYVSESRGGDEL
jgi:hypothetical protein